MKIGEKEIQDIVEKVGGISDRGQEGLAAWGKEFVAAHTRAPGGLTIEVGTRIGGSAVLWAALLELMYPAGKRPPLWTVDPYGSKPYVGGDPHGVCPPIYDLEIYGTMKKNLSRCPYHTHWMMPSVEFFKRLDGLPYWLPGEKTMRCEVPGGFKEMPIGEAHIAGRGPGATLDRGIGSASFILLDGEHSADSIGADLGAALPWLKPGGSVVVDNVDTDPTLLPRLKQATHNAPPGEFEFDRLNRWLFVRRPLV